MGLVWAGLGALSNTKPDQLRAGKQLLGMDGIDGHLWLCCTCVLETGICHVSLEHSVFLTHSKRQAFVEVNGAAGSQSLCFDQAWCG